MVTIMDMTTAERINDVDRYGDEVLNANWLPEAVLQPSLHEVHATPHWSLASISDPDAFMRLLYQAQE